MPLERLHAAPEDVLWPDPRTAVLSVHDVTVSRKTIQLRVSSDLGICGSPKEVDFARQLDGQRL